MSGIPEAYYIAIADSLRWIALGSFFYLVMKGWAEIVTARAIGNKNKKGKHQK